MRGYARHTAVSIAICFVLGLLTTIAEPDLQVLAQQVASIDTWTLILTVALGVGFFLAVAAFCIQKAIPVRT